MLFSKSGEPEEARTNQRLALLQTENEGKQHKMQATLYAMVARLWYVYAKGNQGLDETPGTPIL